SGGGAPGVEGVAARLGHAPGCPGRVPHHVDTDLVHAGLAEKALAHVVEDELRCGAAHGREREVDLDHAALLADAVDHAQVDEVDRHLGVLDLGERVPVTLGHDSWWCALRKLWNSCWNMATISALRGPRARQRRRTSSHEIGRMKSQRLCSASNSQGKG